MGSIDRGMRRAAFGAGAVVRVRPFLPALADSLLRRAQRTILGGIAAHFLLFDLRKVVGDLNQAEMYSLTVTLPLAVRRKRKSFSAFGREG